MDVKLLVASSSYFSSISTQGKLGGAVRWRRGASHESRGRWCGGIMAGCTIELEEGGFLLATDGGRGAARLLLGVQAHL